MPTFSASIGGLLAAVALLPAVAGAVTFKVNEPFEDKPDAVVGDGICSHDSALTPPSTVCTLRAAVMEANATDPADEVTILLTPGQTYELTIPGADEAFAETGDLDIRRPMTIGVADPAAGKAKIDATGTDRAFDFFPGANDSKLEGIEIVGGFVSDGEGTAISSNSQVAKITLEFLDVHDNHSTAMGPGFRCTVFANAIMRDSHVHHNGSEEVAMRGVCAKHGAVTIVRSTLDHNSHDGIDVQSGSLWLHTSTVSENDGGGIYLRNSDATIYGSTIASNRVDQIHFATLLQAVKALKLFGSILEGAGTSACVINQYDDSELTFTAGWNLYDDATCISDTPMDNSLSDAMLNLSELGDFGGPTPTHLPLPGSDAIDFAPPTVCDEVGIDQRGLPRPVAQDGMLPPRCDIGAVEVQPVLADAVFLDGFETD